MQITPQTLRETVIIKGFEVRTNKVRQGAFVDKDLVYTVGLFHNFVRHPELVIVQPNNAGLAEALLRTLASQIHARENTFKDLDSEYTERVTNAGVDYDIAFEVLPILPETMATIPTYREISDVPVWGLQVNVISVDVV